ncbi:MAG: ribulose bisphosphate carboxylase small subunit [Bacillota bacterium]|uniref:ribulose bisphosphate carboxylase small subunit n=1 Tax=Desulforamulus profundi TaxID=1383067 RepID=UPI000BFFBED2|nr:ribulose bisphosphate carboxylase small subunit [Desulforamulus profundi]
MGTVKQGAFAFMPPLNEDQVREQIQWVLNQGYCLSVEYTDEPHPRNNYWRMWGLPMFDLKDAAAIMYEFQSCKKAFPDCYIKINGYDADRQGQVVSFIAYYPADMQ